MPRSLHRRRVSTALWGALLAAAAVLLARCDTGFNPIQESDLYFSVFGFLDAAADTQFIRITPVRDSIALRPNRPIDATVTLEHLASGRTTRYRDSLFVFGDRIAFNYWSADAVDHDAAYRLTVVRSDGVESAATVTLPPSFPTPDLVLPPQPGTPVISTTAAIRVSGVERLADLSLVFRYRLPGQDPANTQTLTLSYLDRLVDLGDGVGVQFRPYSDFFRRARGCPVVDDVQVVVAAAGPEWPDFLAFDDETLALADAVSNVENGVGFLGGVSSKRLAWEDLRIFLAGSQATCAQCVSFLDPRFCFP